MASDQIFVGLEIGTTKICVIVSEGRSDGTISILGVGETPSRGVRKGEIVDLATVTECVREAILDAEDKTNVEIGNVWVAISGAHLRSFNNRGTLVLPEERQIEPEDLETVETNAKEVALPPPNIFLHTILQAYHVDGNRNVIDPLTSEGALLEADFHIVHGIKTRIHNTLRCIESLKLGIEDVVLSSLASAQVVLNQDQKNYGALMIDIGGGTTDYIVYIDGSVKHSGVLAIGGDHITSDISVGLRLPIARAEVLKIQEGSAADPSNSEGGIISLQNDPGFMGCEIDRSSLDTIIHLRVREIFELIRNDIESAGEGMLGLIRGVMITGGCSRLRGIASVAEEIFDLPVELTRARNVGGATQVFENPQYSTAIGLTKYAKVITKNSTPESMLDRFTTSLGDLFKKRSR
ncbi:MAG: cell division protein FtsA [Verrucomicrobia bacterium]|jgi:cell division protein FtsA|nr:cell division protein FtsA [Verrucomicrobiota bacterium]